MKIERRIGDGRPVPPMDHSEIYIEGGFLWQGARRVYLREFRRYENRLDQYKKMQRRKGLDNGID